jgi:hypothetical protein
MLAIDPLIRILNEALASEGPSTHTLSPCHQAAERHRPGTLSNSSLNNRSLSASP